VDKMTAVLLGMTGFGNAALDALLSIPYVQLKAVVTPEHRGGRFPYYECQSLQETAAEKDIPLFEGLHLGSGETADLFAKISPDVIVVATFDQIVPVAVIAIPPFGVVNVHPSLLPKYRGATPTVWAILNGEKETGVTAHFIENEGIDRGRIISQASVAIDADETDGSLRRKLADISVGVLKEAVQHIRKKNRDEFPLQDEREATYFPKRSLEHARIKDGMHFEHILRIIRAMTPFPYARYHVEGDERIVIGAELASRPQERTASDTVVNTPEGMVILKILKRSEVH
jgi:methionyl-tRNA formyltransferase